MSSNGQEVVDYIDKLLEDIEMGRSEPKTQPVALLLLDINMPLLSGMEACKLVKEKYHKLNKRL